jgi:hypothetical protein
MIPSQERPYRLVRATAKLHPLGAHLTPPQDIAPHRVHISTLVEAVWDEPQWHKHIKIFLFHQKRGRGTGIHLSTCGRKNPST